MIPECRRLLSVVVVIDCCICVGSKPCVVCRSLNSVVGEPCLRASVEVWLDFATMKMRNKWNRCLGLRIAWRESREDRRGSCHVVGICPHYCRVHRKELRFSDVVLPCNLAGRPSSSNEWRRWRMLNIAKISASYCIIASAIVTPNFGESVTANYRCTSGQNLLSETCHADCVVLSESTWRCSIGNSCWRVYRYVCE